MLQYIIKREEMFKVRKTERLFDSDAYMRAFESTVLSCEKCDDGYDGTLAATCFFPNEGGQSSDRGRLGGASVSRVYEKQGIIYHVTDSPVEVGEVARGEISFDERFVKMQNHTGEHIISGIVHKLHGYANVGFHLGDGYMTVDFDGELTREQLDEIELLANRAVIECHPIKAYYPEPRELEALEYRSKLSLSEGVRIVDIEGVDRCACCAPHVKNTGEVGIIKILDFIRYKGGVRLNVLCGLWALLDYGERYREMHAVSTSLSVKQNEISAAVARLSDTVEQYKTRLLSAKKEILSYKLDAIEATEGNICIFEEEADMGAIRAFVNSAVEKCGGMCAVFAGNDSEGYKYIIASREIDLKARQGEISAALSARGGGSSQMLQGSSSATREQIERYFGGVV